MEQTQMQNRATPGQEASVSVAATTNGEQHGPSHLQQTLDAVARATQGLSELQWRYKPGADRWSISEIVEHLHHSEEYFYGDVVDRVMQAPAGQPDRDVAAIDAMVLAVITDRTNKGSTPAPLRPQGLHQADEALRRFFDARRRTIAFVERTSDLREHVVDSPLGQPLDALEWLLLASGHAERHVGQIEEVKADPGFPG